jgi:hypothetical protein
MGAFKTIVYETDNFDTLSHSVHNRVYNSEVDLRTITQREGLTDWIGSHNVDSFLPTRRHIVGEKDTLVFPITNVKFNVKLENITPAVSVEDYNICKNEPYNVLCKKRVKLTKKRVSRQV